MAFAFKQSSGIERQVRDIACEQIDKALAECRQPDIDFDGLVHSLRRRCKKLRGLVRLIAPRFKHAQRENRAFRDAAAELSGARDAVVMVETFAALLEHEGKRADGSRIDMAQGEALAAMLRGRVGAVPDAQQAATLLRQFSAIFEAAEKRAARWSLSGRGFEQLGDGLEDTYRRMRSGLATAQGEQTAEALHDWRKDTKYHWHHVSLLQAAAHDLLKPRKASLDQLAEMLGDHHNLAVLDQILSGRRDADTVRTAIAERQAALAHDAFDLGRQLVAEKPSMLRERFEQYWTLLPEKD